MGSFSLIEELLLLTLEDRGGEFDRVPEAFLVSGVAGGALIDLSLRGKLDSDLSAVWVVDSTPTGDAILDRVLAEVAAEPRRLDARAWIMRLAPRALAMRAAVIKGLCGRGVLRRDGPRYLWAESADHHASLAGRETKRRILHLLFSNDIPAPEDVPLIAMADACFVFERILAPGELRKVATRIQQLCRMDLIGAQIARAAQQINLEFRAAERKTVIAGLAGNVLEWYDFGVYGYFAAAIGTQFFPTRDPATSLLASFAVFAIGFLSRPLGGMVFGAIGDRLGRRAAVMGSVVTMAIPTCLMAALPTYAQIGIVAPLLLIVLRLAQGLAVGGEYTTSMVLLVEQAQPSRRGRVGSFAPFGAFGGLLLGSTIGWAITDALTQAQSALWGWRIAFLTGLVIGLVVFIVRRRLPHDTAIAGPRPDLSPLVDVWRTQKRAMLEVVGFNLATAVGFYLCFVYITTWLHQVTALAQSTALLINSLGLVELMVLTPLLGIVSDRIGRKPILYLGAAGLALLSVPLLWLIAHGTLLAIMTGQLGFAFFISCFGGAGPAFSVEAFPKHVRCSGLSIGYNLAMSIFGGTVPMIAVYLIAATGHILAPAWYLAAVAVIAGWMAAVIRGQDDAAA
ncbi:MAG TPA: MFS transporter [Stellaceae bacterium]|nr:MFS transporter [Stellaceae bacterium]